MEELDILNPSYPPKEENTISQVLATNDWDFTLVQDPYGTLYKIFPQRREDLYEVKYVKQPIWKYFNGKIVIRMITNDDMSTVEKFLMQEYVFLKKLWEEFGVGNQPETYKIYKDILGDLLPEGNSFIAEVRGRIVGLFLATYRDASDSDFSHSPLYDPKLAQVMEIENCLKSLGRLLELANIRSYFHARFAITSSDELLVEKNETLKALLKAFWEWVKLKSADCALVMNSEDGRAGEFARLGYTSINSLNELDWLELEDERSSYNDQTTNKTCFFLKFRNKDCAAMYSYNKGQYRRKYNNF